MVKQKLSRRLSEPGQSKVPDKLQSSLIWDVGRAYFAYVGLLERVLVEQKLDHILRPGMGAVLFALYEHDQVTIKDLSERSQLACSTLTGVLQRMENAGVIVRSRDAEDGRLVRVALTKLGRKLESKCREVAHRMTEVSEQSIGAANVELCAQLLRNLAIGYRTEEHHLSTAAARKK